MSGVIKSGAVLFASDVERVAHFYEAVVPMARIDASHGALFLENAALQLVIHPLPAAIAAQITLADPPALRESCAIKLVFAVDSLMRVRDTVTALGGGMNPPWSAFEASGFQACDGHDPEGNIIQFREPFGGQ